MNHKTNLGIRAVLHTARKWKKTLLVFFLRRRYIERDSLLGENT